MCFGAGSLAGAEAVLGRDGAAAAAAGAAGGILEACFEVELEGCRRRRGSSPAEDEVCLLRPPSSPNGGCNEREKSQRPAL